MTSRVIIGLAVAATAFLVLGARLLDAPSAGMVGLAVAALVAGTALSAAAVAGAWRGPAPQVPAERRPAD